MGAGDGAGFTDPVAYSPWLLGSAMAVAGLVALWYLGLVVLARTGPPQYEPAPLPAVEMQTLRERCLHAIDDIERQVHEGTMERRTAYERLSAIIRDFIGDATGLPLDRMTLSDVRASGLPRLPRLLEVIYPLEFGPADPSDPTATLRAARELVATW